MKKILSFFAFAAMVFSFAACGGEPEIKSLQVKANALWTKAQVIITPSNSAATYFYNYAKASEVEAVGLEQYVTNQLASKPWEEWESSERFDQGKQKKVLQLLSAQTKYILYVCFVEKYNNEEDEGKVYAKIAGDIVPQEFTTTRYWLLNGEFTVNANNKKVQFNSANSRWQNGSLHANDADQWSCFGRTQAPEPYDLLDKSVCITDANREYVLSGPEWWYLFMERPRAEELFAHGTVNNITGLIVLPDNWETPEGVKLITDKELGILRASSFATQYFNDDINGYSKNKYTKEEWADLEYAGAVFLPAAGMGGLNKNVKGYYWSRTGAGTGSNIFRFERNLVDLTFTKNSTYDTNGSKMSLRLVREVGK